MQGSGRSRKSGTYGEISVAGLDSDLANFAKSRDANVEMLGPAAQVLEQVAAEECRAGKADELLHDEALEEVVGVGLDRHHALRTGAVEHVRVAALEGAELEDALFGDAVDLFEQPTDPVILEEWEVAGSEPCADGALSTYRTAGADVGPRADAEPGSPRRPRRRAR